MPSSTRRAVRWLLAAALVAAAVAAWAIPSLAALPGTEVTVVTPAGKKKFAWLDRVAPDVNTTFKLRRPGQPDKDVTIAQGDGVSLWKVLNKARADLQYTKIWIRTPGGRRLTFNEKEVRTGPFRPLFYVDDGGQLFFFRPSSGIGDYSDHFPISGSAVELTQEKTDLDVSLEASDTKVEVGDSVDFTAKVDPSGTYNYDWSFSDTKKLVRRDRTMSHTFKKEGTFLVSVGVKIGSDTNNSGQDSVQITVGDAKQEDTNDDVPPASPPGIGGVGGGGSGYTPVPSTPTPTPPTPTPTPEPTPPPDIATSGLTVSGNLLADASDPPATSALESAVRAARERNPQDEPEEASVSTAALGIAGLIGLMGLGAGLELRQGGRRGGRRLPRPRIPKVPLPRRGA